MIYWFKHKYEQIQRFFFWGWKLRNSHDWDSHTIYEMLYLKLDRIYDTMKKDSHLMWNSDEKNNGMRKLLEAKGLARDLYDNQFGNNRVYFHEKFQFPREEGDIFAKLGVSFPDAKIIDKKLWKFYFKKDIEREDKRQKEKVDRLHYLLTKYIQHWWD